MDQFGSSLSAINCTTDLPDDVASYVRESLAENSRRAYLSDLREFERWGGSIPASAETVASYVAASRVQMKRHYLSDVTFGAALGIVAGRTVPIGHGRRLLVTPMATPSGAAAGFTFLGKR